MYGLEKRIARLTSDMRNHLNESYEVVENIEIRKGRLTFPCVLTELDGFVPYKNGEVWSGENFDDYALFKIQVKVPPKKKGTYWGLDIRTNKGNGHNMVRPQMLLFDGNTAICGLDTNHESIPLKSYKPGEMKCFYVYAFSGLAAKTPYGDGVDMDVSDGVRLFVNNYTRNEEFEDLYYNVNVPLTYLSLYKEDSYEYIQITEKLNEALSMVDFREFHSPEFYESVKSANKYLADNLYGKCGDGKITLVGHTHIDVAWLWRYEHTVDKAVRSFATEVKLLKEFDDHRFMSSQAQLYDFVKRENPELYQEIKDLSKCGKWEAEGAMWVEPDMNLSSGESIIQQILYGKKFFKEDFGVDCKILWLPDVFGYTAALPQILKKSGIDYFMTSKLAGNDTNRFPYDTFMWKGIDGTEVLSHCTNYAWSYNSRVEQSDLLVTWQRYAQKNINDDILLPFGFADGGGGVSYGQIETVLRGKRGIPGMPEIKIGTVGDYFERLDEKVSGNKRLPVWSGEIYYENHRGTYTSMARIKKQNRQCEYLYSNARWLSALADSVSDFSFPYDRYEKGIKNVLLNQFHDVLPGTSIGEVYEDADALYEESREIGTEICHDAVVALDITESEGKITVFNPYSEKVSGYVEFDGKLIYAEDVPAKGYGLYDAEITAPDVPVTVSDNVIENKYYIISFNKNGEIISLYDKQNGRETFKNTANKFRIYEDKCGLTREEPTFNEENWNLEMFYTEHEYTIPDSEFVQECMCDGERAIIRTKRNYMSSEIVQDMVVYARSPRIDFKTEIDWKERNQVLKTEFPVDVNATRATYEIQFGYIERPTVYNTSWEKTKFEVCAHKWADISDGGYGMSLFNDCKYGHSADGSTMTLTLLRCGCSPYPDADKEHHSFTYSIIPHSGDFRDCDVVKEANMLNNPLFAVPGSAVCESFSLFETSGAVLDTVKPAEDGNGLILRFYEPYNRAGKVCVKSELTIKDVSLADIMENPVKGEKITTADDGFSFDIKPFEIVTVRVNFKK